MSLIFGLLILALVLFTFEILIPGGVLGVLGAIAVIVACVIAYFDYGTMPAISFFIISSIAIGLFIVFELWLIRNTSLGDRILLKYKPASAVNNQSASSMSDLIGQTAKTITPLTPTGLIEVNGKQYEGLSRDGQIAKGEIVRIVSKDSFRIVVEYNK